MTSCARNCGLVFIASEDPISRITRAITKQEFTTVGFYCSSSCTGREKDLVILIDMFGVTIPCWASPEFTMEGLMKNPLVSRMAIMKLKDPALVDLFRMIVADATSACIPPDVKGTVHSIFGFTPSASRSDLRGTRDGRAEAGRRKGRTAINVLNEVIDRMGKGIPMDERVSLNAMNNLKLPRKLSPGTEAKYQVLDIVAFPFTSQPGERSISSYLSSNDVFGELEEVQLPRRNPKVVEKAKEDALKKYRPSMDRLISVIIDEMMNDPQFFQQVLDGINFGLQTRALGDDMSRGMLEQLMQNIRNYEAVTEGNPNTELPERQLLDDQANAVSRLFDLSPHQMQSVLSPLSSAVQRFNPHGPTQGLEEMVERLASDVRLGNKGRLDVNGLIEEVNRLTGSNIMPINGETVYPATFLITNNSRTT